jgi:hypothetical protein
MTTRLDALMARKYTDKQGQEKTAFTRIGTAFQTRTGDGYSIVLDAMPAPDKETGQYRILLMPPRQDADRPASSGSAEDYREKRTGNGGHAGLDDDIPFAPEVR